ncbi:MAG: triose-phosphate isomerase [Verrucomicrobiota bacterium]
MSTRRTLIAGNWKMNKNATESVELVNDIIHHWKKVHNVDVVICPPFTSLHACKEVIDQSAEIFLGAQNMHEAASGAYTGEISAAMLKDLWCKYVILGHSERRENCHETDAIVNKKAKVAVAANLNAIICVGETLQERESGKMEKVVTTQVKASCDDFTEDDWERTVIAYEPVWAIGTGKTASPEQAQEVHALIRNTLREITSEKIATKVQILYGGSVKPANSAELLGQNDIDGALVGGASLDAESFVEIVKNACHEESST